MSDAGLNDHPRMRPVEAFPVEVQGQEMICLRDPQGFAAQPVFLPPALAFLVSRMDGTNSVRDIQVDFYRATGEILPLEHLERLVQELDSAWYLDSPAFRAHYDERIAAFARAPQRAATHAGVAYEQNGDRLREQLRAFMGDPDGPGTARLGLDGPLRGLIAPHIDFQRGGPTYAYAYRALESDPADTFIIFGTCHSPMQKRFALTRKDYETPLGAAENDRDFVDALTARIGEQYYTDEFAHRGEHSIEFQAVWLRYILGGRRPCRIVPILVGSLHDLWADGKTPGEDPEIGALVSAVRDLARERPGLCCVIAAADLAHVGRRFGDPSGPTQQSLSAVERKDLEFLSLASEGNAEGLFRSIAADEDSRHVCGYPPVYLTLRCIDQPRGKLLKYTQWADLDAGAAVTFASLAIY